MNLPNKLTLSRIVLAPVFVVLMMGDHVGSLIAAYIVFMAASITDYLDGRIARKRGLVSNFGKLLDPVADKVLMAAAFVMFMELPDLDVPGWTVVAILGREFLITGARSLAASDGVVIAANTWGKGKTVLQMVYIFTFLFLVIVSRLAEGWAPAYAESISWWLHVASLWAIVAVALYTLYSGVQFLRTNWSALMGGSAL